LYWARSGDSAVLAASAGSIVRVGGCDSPRLAEDAMELSFWAATDVGRKREHNEDNFLVDKKLSLFVVADGMGGHASGEVASHIAVHEMRNAVETKKELIEGFAAKDGKVLTQDLLSIIEQAV